jgi:hypothetical protein
VGPLKNLKELVFIDRSDYAPTDAAFVKWENYFNNTFEVCDNHEDVCPVEPGDRIDLVDNHSPSNSEGAWFRATEHYFTGESDLWIGCVTTVYQTVN